MLFGDVRDLVHGAIEGRLVRLGGLVHAADLAHVLPGRGLDLVPGEALPLARVALGDGRTRYVERTNDLLAKAYRDAFSQTKELIATVLEAQSAVMAALANRLTNQETLLETQRAMLIEAAQAQTTSTADTMAAQFMQLAVSGESKPKPTKPNGATNGR